MNNLTPLVRVRKDLDRGPKSACRRTTAGLHANRAESSTREVPYHDKLVGWTLEVGRQRIRASRRLLGTCEDNASQRQRLANQSWASFEKSEVHVLCANLVRDCPTVRS